MQLSYLKACVAVLNYMYVRKTCLHLHLPEDCWFAVPYNGKSFPLSKLSKDRMVVHNLQEVKFKINPNSCIRNCRRIISVLFVLYPLHLDVISHELIDIGNYCLCLDVHQNKWWANTEKRHKEDERDYCGISEFYMTNPAGFQFQDTVEQFIMGLGHKADP